jgi:hypothetical protein
MSVVPPPHNPSPETYAPTVPEFEEPPDASDDRIVTLAQWVALAAAIVTVPAGILAAATVVGSYRWSDDPRLRHSEFMLVASHSSGFIVLGVLCTMALAIGIYVVARVLPWHLGGGAFAFFVIAAVFALLAGVLLLAPEVLLGTDPLSVARGQAGGLTDAALAGLGLLLAAGLLAVAGGLALGGLARARRRAAAGPANRRPVV